MSMRCPDQFRAALIWGFTALAAISIARAETLKSLCPDRPGKGTAPCTVDQGHFQFEVDAFDLSQQRQSGLDVETYVLLSPTIKYGLTSSVDVEVSFSPWNIEREHIGSKSDSTSGFGDLYLKNKDLLTPDDSRIAIALEPFVKIPTAKEGLGNGAIEGGVLLPLAATLNDGWSISSTPEIDLLQNSIGTGKHASAVDVLGLSRSFEYGFTVGAELWLLQDFDPHGQSSQHSFDLTTAWQPPSDSETQWDAGLNFGLNRHTPDLQFYFGYARRL